jgi:hypothetical protein
LLRQACGQEKQKESNKEHDSQQALDLLKHPKEELRGAKGAKGS